MEPPTRLSVSRLRGKFETDGTIRDIQKERSSGLAREQASSVAILDSFARSPQNFTLQYTSETGMSKASVDRILHRVKMKVLRIANWCYHTEVRTYLHNVVPSHWVEQRRLIECSANSADFTSLDFYLWGYERDVHKKPRTL
ncbi:hypothetical protein TNCV_3517541 [Trichonephila clavipes]|nr:hypothetical protein TNCV_3517541 [Trichonephila clavipes]